MSVDTSVSNLIEFFHNVDEQNVRHLQINAKNPQSLLSLECYDVLDEDDLYPHLPTFSVQRVSTTILMMLMILFHFANHRKYLNFF